MLHSVFRTFFRLHSSLVALLPYSTLSMFRFFFHFTCFLRAALFYVALFSCCNLFVFLSFFVALFSCCFFVLHSFNVILSSCCTIFMLKCYLFSEQVFRKKLRCDCFFFICCVKSAIWKFY